MSNVISFPLTPLWNPNLSINDPFILNKTNVDLFKSFINSLPSESDESEDDAIEFFENIEKVIDENDYILMEFGRRN